MCHSTFREMWHTHFSWRQSKARIKCHFQIQITNYLKITICRFPERNIQKIQMNVAPSIPREIFPFARRLKAAFRKVGTHCVRVDSAVEDVVKAGFV